MAIINGYTAETIKTTLDKINSTTAGLSVSDGGTGQKSLTKNAFLLGNNANAIKNISVSGGTGRGYLYWAGSTSADPQISLQPIISLEDGGTGNDDWKSSSHNNLVIFDHTNRKLSPKIKIAERFIQPYMEDRPIQISETSSVNKYTVYGAQFQTRNGTTVALSDKTKESATTKDILISGEAFWFLCSQVIAMDNNLGAYEFYLENGKIQTKSDLTHLPYCLSGVNYKIVPRLKYLEDALEDSKYNPKKKKDSSQRSISTRNSLLSAEDDEEEENFFVGKTIPQQLEELETSTESIQSAIDETINPAIQSIGDRMDNVEAAETNISSFLQDLDLENKIADIDENISHISSTLGDFDIDDISEKLQAIEDSNIYSRLNAVESLALENESGLNSQYSQLFDINNTTIPAINNNIANMNTTITGRLNTLETFKTDTDNLNLSTNLSSLNQFKEDIEDLDLGSNLETINNKIVKVAKCLSKVSEVNTANEFSVDESGNIEFNSEDNTPYAPSQGDVISGGTVVVIEDNSSGDDPLSPGGEGSFEPVSVLDFSDNNFVIIEDDSITSVTIPDEEVNIGHSFKIANLTNNSSALSISFADLHTTLRGTRVSNNSYSLFAGTVATFICIKKVEQQDYFVYTWLVY